MKNELQKGWGTVQRCMLFGGIALLAVIIYLFALPAPNFDSNLSFISGCAAK